MRRPTRTRRLSIAATVSLLAFVVVAGAGVRSLWTWDVWTDGNGRVVGLEQGCIIYTHTVAARPDAPSTHLSGNAKDLPVPKNVLGFAVENRVEHNQFGNEKVFGLRVPVWFPLLLLLIAPVRWIFARPATTMAFPVVTKQP